MKMNSRITEAQRGHITTRPAAENSTIIVFHACLALEGKPIVRQIEAEYLANEYNI
jgi:hypothetical protein